MYKPPKDNPNGQHAMRLDDTSDGNENQMYPLQSRLRPSNQEKALSLAEGRVSMNFAQ